MKTGKIFLFVVIAVVTISCSFLSAVSSNTDQPVDSSPSSDSPGEEEAAPAGDPSSAVGEKPAPVLSSGVIDPAALEYTGAFRLPGEEDRPRTFMYGGNAMTFYPDGDPDGDDDGFPGSLFISGHERIAYGEVPDGDQIAEVSIPAPIVTKNLDDLPVPVFLQDFTNVIGSHFAGLEEIPRMGLQYLDHPSSGPALHISFGQHIQFENQPSHAMVNVDLDPASFQGEWYIGDLDPHGTNGFILDLPQPWADAYANGYPLATGRMRDGGLAGMGPSLYAYQPFQSDGSTPADGAHLDYVTLLQYQNALNTDDISLGMTGYQHPDEWEGAAFLTDPDGKQAVIFTGTKGTGDKFWYGYLDPDDPTRPCVDTGVTDYVTCRMADGSSCPAADFSGCCDEPAGNCATNRGWWSNRFDAQIIFYDPADLANVASGNLDPWMPQPYATLDIDDQLFFAAPEWDRQMLGWGDQRRFRIGDAAFDRENGILYVLELFGDSAKPVVHVWRLTE